MEGKGCVVAQPMSNGPAIQNIRQPSQQPVMKVMDHTSVGSDGGHSNDGMRTIPLLTIVFTHWCLCLPPFDRRGNDDIGTDDKMIDDD